MGNRPPGVHPTYWSIYTQLLGIPLSDVAGRARVAQSILSKPDLVATAQQYGVREWLETTAICNRPITQSHTPTLPQYGGRVLGLPVPPVARQQAPVARQQAPVARQQAPVARQPLSQSDWQPVVRQPLSQKQSGMRAPSVHPHTTAVGASAIVVHPHADSYALNNIAQSDPRMVAFENEEERRSREFKEKSNKRREDFMRQIATMGGDGKALALLGLHPDYTEDELRTAYRKRALATHPDKAGGSEHAFDQVTKAWAYLAEELKRRKSAAAGFQDLRASATTAAKYENNRNTDGPEDDGEMRVAFGLLNPKKFNIDMFNKIFEATKIAEPEEDGYGDWLSSGHDEDPSDPAPVFSGAFNRDVFNKMFEDRTSQTHARRADSNGRSTALTQFTTPEELQLSNSIGHSELGGGRPAEFTASFGSGGMNFTDLRAAYTEHNTITPAHDPRAEACKGRTTLRDYEAERAAAMAVPQSDEERAYESQRERDVINREHERVGRLSDRDNRHAALHNRMETGRLLPDQVASLRGGPPPPIHPRSAGALPPSAHTQPLYLPQIDSVGMTIMDRRPNPGTYEQPLRISDRGHYSL